METRVNPKNAQTQRTADPAREAALRGPRGEREQLCARHGDSPFRSADSPKDRRVAGHHYGTHCPWPALNQGTAHLGDPSLL